MKMKIKIQFIRKHIQILRVIIQAIFMSGLILAFKRNAC